MHICRYHSTRDSYFRVALISCVDVSTDWIEQCLTSPPTQYRLYGRRFLQVKRPNQQYQSTEGGATKEKAKNKNN